MEAVVKANSDIRTTLSTEGVVGRKRPILVFSVCSRRSCRRIQFCFSSADENHKCQLRERES